MADNNQVRTDDPRSPHAIQRIPFDRLDGRRLCLAERVRRQRGARPDPAEDGLGHRQGQRRRGRIGHVLLEGDSVRESAGRRAALEGARRSRCVGRPDADHADVRQCLCPVRTDLRSRLEQPVRPDDLGDAQPGGRQRGLPVPQHLASRERRHQAAGDRLHPRRQQRFRLHRRSCLRRGRARQVGQRHRRHGELPRRHLRLA